MSNFIIPTFFKDKIPKELSYPTGAEEISRELSKTPQLEEIRLSFYFRQSNLFLTKETLFSVLELRFSHPHPSRSSPQHAFDANFYRRKWQIIVFAVPRELRNAISQKLMEEGFPEIRTWLGETIDRKRQDDWATLSLFYDREKEKLIYEKRQEP